MKWCLAGWLLLLPGLSLAQIPVPKETRSVTITGVCVGTTWRVYRTKEWNLWVGCGNARPPAGSVELRAYSILQSTSPRR